MKPIHTMILSALAAVLLAGCYTQFGPTREERYSRSEREAQEPEYADSTGGGYATDEEYQSDRDRFYYGDGGYYNPPYVYDPYYYQPWYRPWLPIGFYGDMYWDYWYNRPYWGSSWGAYGGHYNNNHGYYRPTPGVAAGTSWSRRPIGNVRDAGTGRTLGSSRGNPSGIYNGGSVQMPGGTTLLPGGARRGGAGQPATITPSTTTSRPASGDRNGARGGSTNSVPRWVAPSRPSGGETHRGTGSSTRGGGERPAYTPPPPPSNSGGARDGGSHSAPSGNSGNSGNSGSNSGGSGSRSGNRR